MSERSRMVELYKSDYDQLKEDVERLEYLLTGEKVWVEHESRFGEFDGSDPIQTRAELDEWREKDGD